jgi:hypothetical protein
MSEREDLESLPDVSRRLLERLKEPNPERDSAIAGYEKREAERREREEALLADRQERLRGLPLARHPGVLPETWEGGFLYGRAGVGKTRRSIARLLSVPRDAGIFVDFLEYLDLAREIEFDRASDFARRRWDLIFKRKCLVTDDLGARRATDFAIDCAYRIIDRRWSRGQETLVTSNLSVQEIAERWDERIASRILGFGRAVKMDGPDRRINSPEIAAARPKAKGSAFLRIAPRESDAISQSEVLSDLEPGRPRNGGAA